MNRHELEHLLQLKEEWEDMEGVDDEEGEQDWLRGGIDIYEKLIKLDKDNKVDYLQSLSRLYLNYGRNEKMSIGNFRRATDYLRQAAYIDPKNPKPCYHLSFLMEKERNEEGALFYAERAIRLGLDEKHSYKLYCNIAVCYDRLRFKSEANEYLEKVMERSLQDSEIARFSTPYVAKLKASRKKDYYMPMSKWQKTIIETDDEISDSVLEGERVVLVIHPYRSVLNGERDAVSFAPTKTQILESIMLSEEPISADEIGDLVWGEDASRMSRSYIARVISELRQDLKQATDIKGMELLQTVDSKYLWNRAKLKASVHYKQHRNNRFRPNAGITIL